MGFPPRPYSGNLSPIPSGPSPHGGPPGQERSLGFGGVTSASEATRRVSRESARIFDTILGRIEEVATSLVRDLDDPALGADLQTIVRACHLGTEMAQKLAALGLRTPHRPILLDLADFIRGLELGRGVPEEILYCEDFPDIPCRVLADPGQMEQALRALVANAVDAFEDAPPGHPGVIWVGLERVGRAWIHLQVADNGCGMDAATASRAFAPFFTTKTELPGLGLGLPLAEGFLHQAGGALSLESAPAWGTRVNAWLPVATVSAASPAGRA
jgi:two-component system, cell cycle sensor histidine kinase and response regulator CckA